MKNKKLIEIDAKNSNNVLRWPNNTNNKPIVPHFAKHLTKKKNNEKRLRDLAAARLFLRLVIKTIDCSNL